MRTVTTKKRRSQPTAELLGTPVANLEGDRFHGRRIRKKAATSFPIDINATAFE
jgi:hypothetical protein